MSAWRSPRGAAAYLTVQSAEPPFVSQRVARRLQEVRPEELLLGLLAFHFLYACSHPEGEAEHVVLVVVLRVMTTMSTHIYCFTDVIKCKDLVHDKIMHRAKATSLQTEYKGCSQHMSVNMI